MNRGWLAGLFLFLALAALSTTACAGTLNGLSRYFGWGWSEGYHARNLLRSGRILRASAVSAGIRARRGRSRERHARCAHAPFAICSAAAGAFAKVIMPLLVGRRKRFPLWVV
jgi:hypothetical protein